MAAPKGQEDRIVRGERFTGALFEALEPAFAFSELVLFTQGVGQIALGIERVDVTRAQDPLIDTRGSHERRLQPGSYLPMRLNIAPRMLMV